ncbi:MAG: trypsin-like peptidase domain-containing protein [Bacteroidales bacterium]|nr:trypsin-like peptidase domain-containing protein [Bacteroidales bacterium]
MKKILFFSVVLLAMLCGCSTSPEQLYDAQKSGVVMVINKYYYEMKLPSGYTLYFTGLDEDGDIEGFTEDVADVKQNPAVSFGTAFFIDEKGGLLTNRHVASPPIDKDLVKQNFAKIMNTLQQNARDYMEQLREAYAEAENEASAIVGYDEWGDLVTTDEYRLRQLAEAAERMEQEYEQAQEAVEMLEQIKDPRGIIIEPVCELGLALEGSSPKDEHDFLKKCPCRVVRTAGAEEVDLALLKLTRGTTPEGAYIFDPFEADDNLDIGDAVYMIGYNAGVELSYTKKGILSQLTKGAVTQQPDGERVLYDIATVQGSSGSPVLNERGQLVAVNFAKYARSDNFNLGVPLRAIRNFLK